MAKAPLPSADAIVAREAGRRKIAAYTALASALFVVIAMVVESRLSHENIPDFDGTDLAQTLAIAHDGGTAFPRSFLTAIAQFQLDHAGSTLLASSARAISLLLLIPMVVLLIDAVRMRGGQLGAWMRPVAIAGYVLSALVTVGIVLLQLAVYRKARDAGFQPSDIWDAVEASPRFVAGIADLVSKAAAGITLAMAAVQAVRTGLLPKTIGYLGVFIGLLFVITLDPSGIVRAFWFGALAFVVSGRLVGGTPPAWESGTAVMPEPRQPAAPRDKGGKGDKPGKGAKGAGAEG